MEQAEVEIAGEVVEEIVFGGLLLQGALFLEVQPHEGTDHCDPHPLPCPHAEVPSCLTTQAHDQSGFVTAGLGELVEHALGQTASLGDWIRT